MPKFAVLLLNIGGPTSLESVRPFLENLFLDREIISFGPMEFARTPLAKVIAKRRAAIVRENYRQIGGKSPLAELSRAQAEALQKQLAVIYRDRAEVRVDIGFSYWHPFIAEAMEELESAGFQDVFLLPLYPQYSKATSGSCFKTWRNLHRAKGNRAFRVRSTKSYAEDPAYISAINGRIEETLRDFPPEKRSGVTLLFSAHGTPVKLVEQGDPYAAQIRATVEAVMRLRGFDRPHHLSFQSKVGPARWLEPNTVDTVKRLASEGVKQLLVVPVAFVSDHIETLHELDIELRREAAHAGIEEFRVMPGLNDSPLYIDALARIVTARMQDRIPVPDHA